MSNPAPKRTRSRPDAAASVFSTMQRATLAEEKVRKLEKALAVALWRLNNQGDIIAKLLQVNFPDALPAPAEETAA